MDKRFYSLELHKTNRLTRIFQLAFGIICILVALIWGIFNFSAVSSVWSLMVTIFFLLAFGYYQIISGLGKGEKFIEFHNDKIRLKKNSILSPVEIKASNTEKIELYQLSVAFFIKQKGKLILRFGTTFMDHIEEVKEEVMAFAENNHIPCEYKSNDI